MLIARTPWGTTFARFGSRATPSFSDIEILGNKAKKIKCDPFTALNTNITANKNVEQGLRRVGFGVSVPTPS